MRLLILDGSRIVASLVRRLLPEGVEIQVVGTFGEAMTILKEDPPDAVVADLGRGEPPWRELKIHCQEHRPKIPVLFESSLHRTPEEAGIGHLNHSASFLAKPYHLPDLRRQIRRLLDQAGGGEPRAEPGGEPGAEPTGRDRRPPPDAGNRGF